MKNQKKMTTEEFVEIKQAYETAEMINQAFQLLMETSKSKVADSLLNIDTMSSIYMIIKQAARDIEKLKF